MTKKYYRTTQKSVFLKEPFLVKSENPDKYTYEAILKKYRAYKIQNCKHSAGAKRNGECFICKARFRTQDTRITNQEHETIRASGEHSSGKFFFI